jgi:uncharacterized membrane protein YgdD (TMEM256/DUF423 family)
LIVPRWRWLAATAAVYGLLAVGLAALGAHAIPLPDAAAERLWRTALEMHLFHTAALLGIAAVAARLPSSAIFYCGLAVILGTALFSGTLYLRAAGLEWFPSYLAPTGGTLLIAAWFWLAVILLTKNKD